MESEKVKEIKKGLEYCGYESCLNCEKCSYILDGCNIALIQDALTLINELESENAELKKYRCDWLMCGMRHIQDKEVNKNEGSND